MEKVIAAYAGTRLDTIARAPAATHATLAKG